MECDVYAVAQHGAENGWAIDLNGQVLASGMDLHRAERAAETAARMSKRRGRDAVVLTVPAKVPLSPVAVAAIRTLARDSLACHKAQASPLPPRSRPAKTD